MAKTSRTNADTYLHRPTGNGGTWYARITVPRTLRRLVGQDHLRRSLGTTSKAEANLRKHSVVGAMKTQLAEMRRTPQADDKPGLSFADAREIRQALQVMKALGDEKGVEVTEDVLIDRAEQLESLYGEQTAVRWYRAATVTTENLVELLAHSTGG